MIAFDKGQSQTLLYCNRTFVNETIESIKPELFRSMKRKPCKDETVVIESLLDRMAISHDYLLSTEEIKKKRENSRTVSEENYLTLCLAVRRLILDEGGPSLKFCGNVEKDWTEKLANGCAKPSWHNPVCLH